METPRRSKGDMKAQLRRRETDRKRCNFVDSMFGNNCSVKRRVLHHLQPSFSGIAEERNRSVSVSFRTYIGGFPNVANTWKIDRISQEGNQRDESSQPLLRERTNEYCSERNRSIDGGTDALHLTIAQRCIASAIAGKARW